MKTLRSGYYRMSPLVAIIILLSALIMGVLLVNTGLGTLNSRAETQSDKQYCNALKALCAGKKIYIGNCLKFGKKCLKTPPQVTPTKKPVPTKKPSPTKTVVPTPIIPTTVKYPPTPINYPPTSTPAPTPTLIPTPTN